MVPGLKKYCPLGHGQCHTAVPVAECRLITPRELPLPLQTVVQAPLCFETDFLPLRFMKNFHYCEPHVAFIYPLRCRRLYLSGEAKTKCHFSRDLTPLGHACALFFLLLELLQYDPVVRQHVVFTETKIK